MNSSARLWWSITTTLSTKSKISVFRALYISSKALGDILASLPLRTQCLKLFWISLAFCFLAASRCLSVSVTCCNFLLNDLAWFRSIPSLDPTSIVNVCVQLSCSLYITFPSFKLKCLYEFFISSIVFKDSFSCNIFSVSKACSFKLLFSSSSFLFSSNNLSLLVKIFFAPFHIQLFHC